MSSKKSVLEIVQRLVKNYSIGTGKADKVLKDLPVDEMFNLSQKGQQYKVVGKNKDKIEIAPVDDIMNTSFVKGDRKVYGPESSRIDAEDYKDMAEELTDFTGQKFNVSKTKKVINDYLKGVMPKKTGGPLKPPPNPGAAALPKKVRNKMGFLKKGGSVSKRKAGGRVVKRAVGGGVALRGFGAVRKV
tara:strand:+ start:480 stop:1043 length:564 start_codon:yes stop_codon:yes gene_type:complete